VIASAIFVEHVLGIEWTALPGFTQARALAFLEDTLAVGIAGAAARYADEVHATLRGWGAGGACGILGRPGESFPAPQAAFLNAFQIHAQEFDCVHEPAVVHPMTVVLAALIAEAQRGEPISGADLLAGIVAGVDVAVSLGVAATTPIRFFRPATAGIFGAVAALCRVRQLSRAQALDAFGYALAFVSGTMQPHTEGKPALAVQMAHAAQAAIMALDMALAGLPGPLGAIDGVYGYLPMMETGFDLDRVLPVLGRPHRIDEVSWKPFPSGRATHGAVVATQELVRAHGITAENLDSLVYLAPPLIRHLCGRAMQPGVQVAQARLCIPFAASMVLINGTVALSDYTEENFADSAVLALAARIIVEVDGNADPAAFVPATAIACTKDGREARVHVAQQLGSPARPLSEAQRTEKVMACLDFAGMGHLHPALAAMVQHFAQSKDAGAALRIAQGGAL
jgi:2-methylcitrate dehydratase PrpD